MPVGIDPRFCLLKACSTRSQEGTEQKRGVRIKTESKMTPGHEETLPSIDKERKEITKKRENVGTEVDNIKINKKKY